jgi:metal-sulfur cluster biosynthetic enzyme
LSNDTYDPILLEGDSITNVEKEILKDSFAEYESIIELAFDPPWGHEMISAKGREFLNEQ